MATELSEKFTEVSHQLLILARRQHPRGAQHLLRRGPLTRTATHEPRHKMCDACVLGLRGGSIQIELWNKVEATT